MPSAVRTRRLAAPPQEVWETISQPRRHALWWPKVLRVEGVRGSHFTQVMQTDRGRDIRADYEVVDSVAPELWRVQQEVDGTPFEGILSAAETELRLQPLGAGETVVTMAVTRRLKGVARFGGFMMRRATARQIDAALDNLALIHGDGT